jgi:Predicted membrane protein
MNEVAQAPAAKTDMAKIIYVLYLLGLVTGVTSLVGVIMAYVHRSDAPDWLKSHYTFQIRTFWIMVLYGFICGILTILLIGFLLFILLAVWWVVRCVKGLKYLDQRVAYPDPQTWGF